MRFNTTICTGGHGETPHTRFKESILLYLSRVVKPRQITHLMFATALRRGVALSTASAGIALFAGRTLTGDPALCHGNHSHGNQSKMEMLEARISMLEAGAAAKYGVKQQTGSGPAIFSWDEDLTAALPEECKRFEKDMHGGFNEDPDTGQ